MARQRSDVDLPARIAPDLAVAQLTTKRLAPLESHAVTERRVFGYAHLSASYLKTTCVLSESDTSNQSFAGTAAIAATTLNELGPKKINGPRLLN